MGDYTSSLFSTETAHQLADCLVAGAIWTVHLLAIRSDARLEKATPKPPAPVTTATLAGSATPEERRAYLEQRRADLEHELERVRQELEAL
jgi:hypothetical protein